MCKSWPLLPVLALAAALYAWGLAWGLPSEASWDYDEITWQRIDAVLTDRSMAEWPVRYPPFQLYLLALPFLAAGRLLPTIEHLGLVARSLTLVMALLSLVAVYRAARQLFDRRAAWLAAAIAAFAVPTVYYAKVGVLDVPYVFWFDLSLVFFLRLLDRRRLADYLAFSVTATLAVATKDQAYGLYVLAPIPILVSLWRERRLRALVDGRPILSLLTAAFLFVAVHGIPFHPDRFLAHLGALTGPASEPFQSYRHTLGSHAEMLVQALRHLAFALGTPLLLACLAGVILLLLRGTGRERFRAGSLLLLPVGYYLSFIAVILYHYDRFFLPVWTVLALFGGHALAELSRARRLPATLRALLVAGPLAFNVLRGASLDLLMVNDTRYQVEAWVREHEDPEHPAWALGAPAQCPRIPRIPLDYAFRSAGQVFEDFGAGHVVINTSDWRPGQQGFHQAMAEGALEYRLVLVRRYRSPGGLLDCSSAFTNLAKVSPRLAVYERIREPWWRIRLEEAAASVEALLDFARTERRFGRFEGARRLDAEAASLAPFEARAACGLGLDEHALGNLPEARCWLEEALRLDPGIDEARAALARLLVAEGEIGAARELLAEGPAVPEATLPLLLALGELGEPAVRRRTAVEALDRAADLAEAARDGDTLLAVTRASFALGARERASRAARRALAARGLDTYERGEAASYLRWAGHGAEAGWASLEAVP